MYLNSKMFHNLNTSILKEEFKNYKFYSFYKVIINNVNIQYKQYFFIIYHYFECDESKRLCYKIYYLILNICWYIIYN